MGRRLCCVPNCGRKSHDHLGRRIPNALSFHSFPGWRRGEGRRVRELTRRRRAAWVAAVARNNITFRRIPASARVCSRHFHSGKPADDLLESDPDWVPSLLMGHGAANGRRTRHLLPSEQLDGDEKQRAKAKKRRCCGSGRRLTEPEAAGGGAATAADRPRRDVASLLESALQHQTGAEPRGQPAAEKEAELSFREFFRAALDASLDAAIRSRARSAPRPPRPGGCGVEPSSCSSSCENCARLQSTIIQLQEQLSHVTGRQDVKTWSHGDRNLGSFETVSTECTFQEGAEPLSPADRVLPVDSGVVLTEETVPAPPADSRDGSVEPRRRRPARFQKAWLKRFRFLRYSPSLDHMWCHVCRLHAGASHHNMAFIKGSRIFKLQSLKDHSHSKYHRESEQRHGLQAGHLTPGASG